MKCQHCGMNDATFYYRSNVNGRVTEQRLCADCARRLGYEQAVPAMDLFGDDFFTRPFRMFEPLLGGLGTRMLTEFPEPADVRREARAAVAEPEQAEPGLVDEAEQERLQRERQRNALQAQMKTAIETENFEEAARLRDELKKLA
ncbi:MAG: UvrB/UvrC motif-containing protein [Oscillospiraceae bacterium]|nr:UvrB/UvrC motif-containing protein [Oscillospiraceae bacterium]